MYTWSLVYLPTHLLGESNLYSYDHQYPQQKSNCRLMLKISVHQNLVRGILISQIKENYLKLINSNNNMQQQKYLLQYSRYFPSQQEETELRKILEELKFKILFYLFAFLLIISWQKFFSQDKVQEISNETLKQACIQQLENNQSHRQQQPYNNKQKFIGKMLNTSLKKKRVEKKDQNQKLFASKSPLTDRGIRSVSQNKFANTKIDQLNRSYHIPRSEQKGGRKMKFDSEMDQMDKQLKNNKNKLCSCMQIYGMLSGNLQAQRCLLHNNTLSLYCMNQRRILCVNCLYGMHRHRSHKVIPLKDCMQQIYEDNKKLGVIIEEELRKLDYYSKIAGENEMVIESEMRRIMSEVQLQYVRKIDQIKANFQNCKRLIRQNFVPLIEKCKDVKRSIQEFRFNVWKGFTLYNDQKITEDSEIMKQLLFVTIVQLCQFRNRTITKTQLDSISRKLKLNI